MRGGLLLRLLPGTPMTLPPDNHKRLARHGATQRKATDRRNEAIRQAVSDGASLREVADAVGLSHSAVARIVKKGDEG